MIFTAPVVKPVQPQFSALADLDPKEFTVSVLSLGALGPAGQQRNIELYCASDRYRADRAIISGNSTRNSTGKELCDMQALARRWSYDSDTRCQRMIPFIVRDDGSYVLAHPKQGLKTLSRTSNTFFGNRRHYEWIFNFSATQNLKRFSDLCPVRA